ncbi:hypothetical protein VPH35_030192 [Triticum aestivum]
MLLVLLLIWRNKFKWCGSPLYGNQGSAGGIIAFRYTELVHATKNFSEKLGGGGFGSVYKGVLSDSKTTIAVKKLDGAQQGEKQFRAELWRPLSRPLDRDAISAFIADLRSMAVRLSPPPPPPPPEPD